MEFQFHPGSGRGPVRTLTVGGRGERSLLVAAGAAALCAVSLWVTVPLASARLVREERIGRALAERETSRAERAVAEALAARLKERALDRGDFLNRAAFLYDIPAAAWPRVLDPQHPAPRSLDLDRLAASLERYGRGLERGLALLAERESADAELAARVPSLFPLSGQLSEPSVLFGPRVSPWTGVEEFFPGVDIAAPAGTPVLAPGRGRVVFAGTVRRRPGGWIWRLGNVVVLSHGSAGATLFGHLGRIEARRGQRVSRGERLGGVGATGWALSPQLHYEYWRPEGSALRPTDPLFATLDRRTVGRSLSLDQMRGTSAPGALEPLPGIGIGAEKAAGRRSRPASR